MLRRLRVAALSIAGTAAAIAVTLALLPGLALPATALQPAAGAQAPQRAAGAEAPQPAAASEALGKPVAPFSLAAEVQGPPAVGVPVEVRVTLSAQVRLEDIEIRISADPGLSVDLSDFTLYAPSASPEQPAEWRIAVVPTAEGAHRLRLFGEALVAGQRQGRIGVATIRVGDAAGAERDSGLRGAEPGGRSGATESGDGRDSAEAGGASGGPGSAEAGEASDGEASDGGESEPGTERVIRLPATERP